MSSQVRGGGALSDHYAVERGVKQGSVLFPALFLLVMDPLLTQLQRSGLGLSINNFYTGGFLHADDIRSLATSSDSLKLQVSLVNNFARENFLKLNIQKCEIIQFSNSSTCGGAPQCAVDGSVLPVRTEAKCLGYWWGRHLTVNKSVEENIKKARRSFFHYGALGAFQGDLNPLSTVSVLETCVMPVLLYGSENWILTERCLDQLDSFLGEMAKRALKWPKHFSNTAALMALGMETARSKILIRKLGFLRRQLLEDATGIGALAVRSMLDDPNSLCVVQECRDLEVVYGTEYTSKILNCADEVNVGDLKKEIRGRDREIQMERCTVKAPLIAEVVERGGSWPSLWDAALHLGSRHTTGFQSLSRILAHHGHGANSCPLCDDQFSDTYLIDHILEVHAETLGISSPLSTDELLTQIVDRNITFVYKFRKVYVNLLQ